MIKFCSLFALWKKFPSQENKNNLLIIELSQKQNKKDCLLAGQPGQQTVI